MKKDSAQEEIGVDLLTEEDNEEVKGFKTLYQLNTQDDMVKVFGLMIERPNHKFSVEELSQELSLSVVDIENMLYLLKDLDCIIEDNKEEQEET